MPEKFKGFQLLNHAAACNLGIYKNLPKSGDIVKMVGKRM
jgi:hypothetical protein